MGDKDPKDGKDNAAATAAVWKKDAMVDTPSRWRQMKMEKAASAAAAAKGQDSGAEGG